MYGVVWLSDTVQGCFCGGRWCNVLRGVAWPGFLAAPEASNSVPSWQCSSHTRSPLASSFWHGGYSSFAVKEMQEPLRAGLSLVRRTLGLPAGKWTFQVKNSKHNRKNSKGGKKDDFTHLCGAWAVLALGLVEGRGSHPTGWCQDPSQGLVELEMETSLLHACGGTCHRMLQRENKVLLKSPRQVKVSLRETERPGSPKETFVFY